MKSLKTNITGLLMLVASVFILSSCNNSNTTNTTETKNELFANKTIKVGYISYPPGFIVDPNTKEKSGIFDDVLLEIAKRNGLTVDYKEEVTWATMIEVLKTDRVNLIANPVWATPERKENADFSKPVYFSPIGVFVRADDNRFDADRSKLNDPKIYSNCCS